MKNLKRNIVLLIAVVSCIFIIGGCSSSTSAEKSDSKKSSKQTSDGKPSSYKLSSDPSVTKFPEPGAKFGNGQVLTFEYDGSKSDNDPDATIGYDLSYDQGKGSLVPLSGSFLEGKGAGIFKATDSIFSSSADGKPGILVLSVTFNSGVDGSGKITGTTVELGRYLITIDVAE